MNYKLLSVALAFLYIGMVGGCSQPAPDLRYQIEVDKPLQTMEHFGASDAWSMHILGLWAQEKQNQIATGCSAQRTMRMENRKESACLFGVSTLVQVVPSKEKPVRSVLRGCVPNAL